MLFSISDYASVGPVRSLSNLAFLDIKVVRGWSYGHAIALLQSRASDQVEQWVSETGRPVEELVEDAMAGYFDELVHVRQTLDTKYCNCRRTVPEMLP